MIGGSIMATDNDLSLCAGTGTAIYSNEYSFADKDISSTTTAYKRKAEMIANAFIAAYKNSTKKINDSLF